MALVSLVKTIGVCKTTGENVIRARVVYRGAPALRNEVSKTVSIPSRSTSAPQFPAGRYGATVTTAVRLRIPARCGARPVRGQPP